MRTTYCCIIILLSFFSIDARAQSDIQTPGHIYMDNIKTVKLNRINDPVGMPVMILNSSDVLELTFDDLDNDVKNYLYTIQHCNADWTRSSYNTFDYMRGFPENRIQDSKFSRLTLQRYTHYTLQFPNNNCKPIKSGNYLLKVYLNNDTTQLAFTRRFMVLETKAGLSGFISQPINPKVFKTHQKVNFSINTKGMNVNNPFMQLKVVVMQNQRWDNAIRNIKPMFIKGEVLEFNSENDCIFPAGKEWRWIDLRSFRLQTERVGKTDYRKDGTDIFALPDFERGNMRYAYIKDVNGMYIPSMLDDYDKNTEGDYAKVHFVYPSKEPYAGYDLYLFGELTSYECNESNRLKYNGPLQAYEGDLFLKQGFYNYMYGLIDRTTNGPMSTEFTEGNWWETENNYTVLVYYRSIGGRADELVGVLQLNSMTNRQ